MRTTAATLTSSVLDATDAGADVLKFLVRKRFWSWPIHFLTRFFSVDGKSIGYVGCLVDSCGFTWTVFFPSCVDFPACFPRLGAPESSASSSSAAADAGSAGYDRTERVLENGKPQGF